MRAVYSEARAGASRAIGVMVACCLLAACSSHSARPQLAGDVTGSIPTAPPLVSGPALAFLPDEDWPVAREALAKVLDPQQSGQLVTWELGRDRGSFTPVGIAYAEGLQICRAFLAEITTAGEVQKLQGRACRELGGDWRISDVKPWNS
jgi:surface antigen